MRYRTHLTLSIPGEDQLLVLRGKSKVGKTEVEEIKTVKMPTKVMLLDDYQIGKYYLNDLPDELDVQSLYDEDDYPLWFNEYDDAGEIHVGAMIALLEEIDRLRTTVRSAEEFEEQPWWNFEDKKLLEDLKFWVSSGIITNHHVIQFNIW